MTMMNNGESRGQDYRLPTSAPTPPANGEADNAQHDHRCIWNGFAEVFEQMTSTSQTMAAACRAAGTGQGWSEAMTLAVAEAGDRLTQTEESAQSLIEIAQEIRKAKNEGAEPPPEVSELVKTVADAQVEAIGRHVEFLAVLQIMAIKIRDGQTWGHLHLAVIEASRRARDELRNVCEEAIDLHQQTAEAK